MSSRILSFWKGLDLARVCLPLVVQAVQETRRGLAICRAEGTLLTLRTFRGKSAQQGPARLARHCMSWRDFAALLAFGRVQAQGT
jgi:hypothetical protein